MAKIKFKKRDSNEKRVSFYIETVTAAANHLIEFSSQRVFADDKVDGFQCLEYLLTVGANVFRDCLDQIIRTYAKSISDVDDINGKDGYRKICRRKDVQNEIIKNLTTGIVHALRTSELTSDCEMSMDDIISQVIDNLKNGEFAYSKASDDTVHLLAKYDSDEDKRCPKCNCS